MADNSARTPGSGELMASDDIGGVKHQRVKISIGADGSATDMAAPSDSLANESVPPSALVLLNGSATAWNRAREADAAGDGSSGLGMLMGSPRLFNGATFDRQRGNMEGTLLASAARTAYTTSATQTNYNSRGVVVFLNVTAASGTGGLSVIIFGFDPISGSGLKINPNATAVTTTGVRGYMVYPGANVVTPDIVQVTPNALPRSWAAAVFHGDASSYTYSLGYSLIV